MGLGSSLHGSETLAGQAWWQKRKMEAADLTSFLPLSLAENDKFPVHWEILSQERKTERDGETPHVLLWHPCMWTGAHTHILVCTHPIHTFDICTAGPGVKLSDRVHTCTGNARASWSRNHPSEGVQLSISQMRFHLIFLKSGKLSENRTFNC